MTKQIPLTKGKFALVDDEDFEFLSQWKWHFNNRYACRCIYTYADGVERKQKNRKQIRIFMHREIMNPPSDKEIDHINRCGLDNRKSNLRICTREQNARNSLPSSYAGKDKESIYKGVYLRKDRNKKWVSYIMGKNKKTIYIGGFYSEIEAAIAYNAKAKQLFGEFALLNVIENPNT